MEMLDNATNVFVHAREAREHVLQMKQASSGLYSKLSGVIVSFGSEMVADDRDGFRPKDDDRWRASTPYCYSNISGSNGRIEVTIMLESIQ